MLNRPNLSVSLILLTTQWLSTKYDILLYFQNFAISDIIGQISYYKYRIKVINESLQQLIPQTNQPRQPTLSGLNLTSSISINHGECFTERLECTSTGVIQLKPGTLVDIGYCTTDYTSYANEVCCTAVHTQHNNLLPIHTDTYSGWCLMKCRSSS